jgi:pilus assembly protein Flp/PilA
LLRIEVPPKGAREDAQGHRRRTGNEGSYKEWQRNLAGSKIRSPFRGVVARESGGNGTTVALDQARGILERQGAEGIASLKKQSKSVERSMKMGRFVNFMKDESGATAIEYGLLAALISIAAIAAMTTVGTNLSTTFSTVASAL